MEGERERERKRKRSEIRKGCLRALEEIGLASILRLFPVCMLDLNCVRIHGPTVPVP